ncbi:hypothetical protein IMX26_07630 [Clostridium sp. 'deep sea']|uniref:hypothetical protein n=1 Tax=Clostridium sp. 'deep sea' TaxID=2779445 RepID=UPI0018966553|nr:hypothetical protein [Clostridium sp. 'deep sea']QOR36666.1 hypothetical protein IMX26_07630 [Clostridium sp. 'deep sea']
MSSILLIILALTIMLTACAKSVTLPEQTAEPSQPPKPPQPVYRYVVDLNELPQGFSFKYQDKSYSQQDLKLEYCFNDKTEKFHLITEEYEKDYNFNNYSNTTNIPLSSLANELIRVNIPIEVRPAKPQTYTIHVPIGAIVSFRDKTFIGDNEYILLKEVNYDESFTVKCEGFSKEFYFESFNNNDTIKVKSLMNYKSLKDLKFQKTNLGCKVEIPNNSQLSVSSLSNKKFIVSDTNNTLAYVNKNFQIQPVIYPNHLKIAKSNSGKKYAYLDNSYLVIRDNNGMLISRTYFGKDSVVCEGLNWSPNEKYLLGVFLNTGSQAKFYIFNTTNKKFTVIGGLQKNWFDKITWAANSSGLAFYRIHQGYSESTEGEYLYYNIKQKKLTSLQGSFRDKIKWVNNKPRLIKNNNGLRFEIYDPVRDEFKSKYDSCCDPSYPEDFMGSILKIFDKENKELASIDLFELFKEHNLEIPQNIKRFLPYVAKNDVNDFLYFSVDWQYLSIEDRANGLEPITNIIGFINLKNMKVQFIKDFTNLNYYYSNGEYKYINNYQVDTNNMLIYYYRGNKVDIFNIATSESKTYNLLSNFNKKYYYKDILFIATDNNIMAISPLKSVVLFESKDKFNYSFDNNILAITTKSIENDKRIINFDYYNLDELIKNELTD